MPEAVSARRTPIAAQEVRLSQICTIHSLAIKVANGGDLCHILFFFQHNVIYYAILHAASVFTMVSPHKACEDSRAALEL